MVELHLDRLKMHLYLFSFLLLFFFEGCALSELNLFAKKEKKVAKIEKETKITFGKPQAFQTNTLSKTKTSTINSIKKLTQNSSFQTEKRPKRYLKIEMIEKDKVQNSDDFTQERITSETLFAKKRAKQLIALKKLKLSQLQRQEQTQEEVLEALKKEKDSFYQAQKDKQKKEQDEEFAYNQKENQKILKMHQEAEKLLFSKNKKQKLKNIKEIKRQKARRKEVRTIKFKKYNDSLTQQEKKNMEQEEEEEAKEMAFLIAQQKQQKTPKIAFKEKKKKIYITPSKQQYMEEEKKEAKEMEQLMVQQNKQKSFTRLKEERIKKEEQEEADEMAQLSKQLKKENITSKKLLTQSFTPKHPLTLIPREKDFEEFGTSEIHGSVHYINRRGKPIYPSYTKIYLLPKNYSKQAKTYTVSYLNATYLNSKKEFSFYGLPSNQYEVLIETNHPFQNEKKLYMKKVINIDKQKNININFQKKI